MQADKTLKLSLVQGEPYECVVELLDDLDVVQPLPPGTPRMQVRSSLRDSVILSDFSSYLNRVGESLYLLVPAAVTLTLPEYSVSDIWVGTVRIAECVLSTDGSVTR